jgi:15-cis-phytoene synthase
VTDLDLAYEECRLITRREAKNFYYAFLTLPEAQRRAIYVAYTFCRYCDDSVDAQSSVEDKLERLNALRRQLDACYDGRSDEMVFLGLSDVARRYDIPQEYFQEVLSGVESDLVKTRYQDFEELRRYCYQVASAVGLICIHIFGFSDPRAKDHAVDLGLAMQLTNIARDVKEDLEMGRIYLPQEELARFGYSEEELQAGVFNPAFIDLMRFQTQRARSYFHSGFQLLPHLSPRSRACPAVLGRLYSKVLDRIEARHYDVLNHRVNLSKTEKLRVTAFTWLTSMLPQWRQGPTL